MKINNRTNQTIECTSSHLTSFAVMVDVNGANQVSNTKCIAVYVYIRMYI